MGFFLPLLFAVVFFFGGCGPAEIEKEPQERQQKEQEPEPKPEREAYLGGWLKALCADDIQGSGNKVGDIAEDFSQMDQYGEMLRLHDFCDRTVLLVGAAFW